MIIFGLVCFQRKQRDKSEDRRSSESVDDERDRPRETRDDNEERDDSRQKDDNRVYYDPGIHWCSDCNVFPKTVSEYLDHLHSSDHKQNSVSVLLNCLIFIFIQF